MAKIPVGNFGFQVANPAPQNRNLPGMAFGAADALVDAAGGVASGARLLAAEEERQAKEAERKANWVRSVNAQSSAKNALADLDDDLVAGLNDGRYDKASVSGLHAERANKVIDDAVKGVPQAEQDVVRATLMDDLGRSQRNLRKVLVAKDQADIGAGISAYMENMQRYAGRGEEQRQEAMRNVETFLQSAGPQAGMKADQIAKTVQSFKEGVTLNWLDRSISQNQDNGKALAQIAKDIAEDKFPELDPAKRNFLEAKIQRNQQHLMARAEVAQRKTMASLERMEKRLSWYVENGRDIPASELATFERTAKGTPYEGSVQMIVGEQKAVADLMRLSPAEMSAKIKTLEQDYGATPTKEQIVHLDKIKRFAANSMKLLAESPLDYASGRLGMKVEPLALEQLLADPVKVATVFADRVATLRGLRGQMGASVAERPLLPGEAKALSTMLSQMAPDQQVDLFRGVRRAIGDDAAFYGAMAQIAPDSPVKAMAGTLAAKGADVMVQNLFSPNEILKAQETARLALLGESLLNPSKAKRAEDGSTKTWIMPPKGNMLKRFAEAVGDAFAGAPAAADAQFELVQSTYAGLVASRGTPRNPEQIDSVLLDEAILRTTPAMNQGGVTFLKPNVGMTDADFVAKLREALPEGLRARADRLPLRNVRSNQYVILAGSRPLTDASGAPIIVTVQP